MYNCARNATAGVAVVERYDGHSFINFVERDEEAVSCHAGFWEEFSLRELGDGNRVADCGAEAAAMELEGGFGECGCHFHSQDF